MKANRLTEKELEPVDPIRVSYDLIGEKIKKLKRIRKSLKIILKQKNGNGKTIYLNS